MKIARRRKLVWRFVKSTGNLDGNSFFALYLERHKLFFSTSNAECKCNGVTLFTQ